MSPLVPKLFALGAVMGDYGVMALGMLQSTTPSATDFLGGGAAGGVVSVAMWWVYKEKVDANERAIDRKADLKDLDPVKAQLARIEGDLQYLIRMKQSEHKREG